MATVSTFVCPPASQGVSVDDGGPTCEAGQGAWISVVVAEPFDVSTLSSPDLAAAFGAGFFMVGMAILIGIPVRVLIATAKIGVR